MENILKDSQKNFLNETQSDEDSYQKYCRRSPTDGGNTFVLRMSGGNVVTTDNRWVVPYNRVLSCKFECHINNAICSSVKAIHYICSYINKGSD